MEEQKVRLTVGAMLYDLPKIIPGSTAFLHRCGITDDEILACMVGRTAQRPQLAQIVEIADKIACHISKNEVDTDPAPLGDVQLESIFNILNGNEQNFRYASAVLAADGDEIHFPEKHPEQAQAVVFTEKFQNALKQQLQRHASIDDINSLLDFLEQYTSYLPSAASASKNDVSYYDHTKITTAVAVCVYDYLTAQNIPVTQTQQALFPDVDAFFQQEAFLLYSTDISGIQDFIYTITKKGALKGLRARSFYLEIMMEAIVDELLRRLSLPRANLLYTGGGHAYLLMPNTPDTLRVLDDFGKELHTWFRKAFKTALYIADGWCACSANALRNVPTGSYRKIYRTVSQKISEQKLRRYQADEILEINAPLTQHEHECVICQRSDRLDGSQNCTICASLEKLSSAMLWCDYFTLVQGTVNEPSVIMPFGMSLVTDTLDSRQERLKQNGCVRTFRKNTISLNDINCSKLWIGNYAAEHTFSDLAEKSGGIRRLAVMRADVDNLGQAFVAGFPDRYTTILRTSAFSRSLSLFFKLHINKLLRHGVYQLYPEAEERPRNAIIVYSGGDDVFLIGGWDDIIGFAVDLHRALKKYAQGTLMISAGIGIYPDKYPIYAMARETGELEEFSKQLDGKNAVTLFDTTNRYTWDVLIERVLGEKLALIQAYFRNNEAHGNALLYNMLALIRGKQDGERLNIARFAYLLARLRPDEKAPEEEKERYCNFSEELYRWIQDDESCRELITAILIYVYLYRQPKEETEHGNLHPVSENELQQS